MSKFDPGTGTAGGIGGAITPPDTVKPVVPDGYTLTYSEGVAGWVSFYSFYPDWMIGMNQYFYTFKGGNLYRHNVNNNRNTFYGVFTPTTLKSVFNTAPLENKLFKTINIEGDAAWGVTLETDIQNSGFINEQWFEKKEQSFFAFIRNNTNGELLIRSTNGIGRSYQVNLVGDTIDFSINPLVDLGSIMSIGDYLYFTVPPSVTPALAGEITQINRNYPAGINQIVIDTTIPGTTPIPVQNAFYFYTKNSVAESHGVVGHYCVFEMTNSLTSKIELFAVESEVMKSFP
jgi:hypothetical protein